MGKTVLVFVLICALATLVHSKGDLMQGCLKCIGDSLIYHEVHEKMGIPLFKRDDEIEVKAPVHQVIKGISIQDVNGNGESYIKRGGVGRNDVTFKIKSSRGHGYKFIVDVYAG